MKRYTFSVKKFGSVKKNNNLYTLNNGILSYSPAYS